MYKLTVGMLAGCPLNGCHVMCRLAEVTESDRCVHGLVGNAGSSSTARTGAASASMLQGNLSGRVMQGCAESVREEEQVM